MISIYCLCALPSSPSSQSLLNHQGMLEIKPASTCKAKCILRPAFPKLSLLPTEIRMMIWKLARPDPRIIKLSKSKTEWRGRYYGAGQVHAGVPVPNPLHICYESRQLALQWYTLLFRPADGCGGTYLDTKRDFLYYGPEERKLLVDPEVSIPEIDRPEGGNLWTKDRHSLLNIVVHHTDPTTEGFDTILDVLLLSRWCNEHAKDVLLLGPRISEVKAGTMLSDLGEEVGSFDGEDDFILDTLESPEYALKIVRKLEPRWKNFVPRRMISVDLYDTNNVVQNYGFTEWSHMDHKIDLIFNEEVETIDPMIKIHPLEYE
jgi:2EXR family